LLDHGNLESMKLRLRLRRGRFQWQYQMYLGEATLWAVFGNFQFSFRPGKGFWQEVVRGGAWQWRQQVFTWWRQWASYKSLRENTTAPQQYGGFFVCGERLLRFFHNFVTARRAMPSCSTRCLPCFVCASLPTAVPKISGYLETTILRILRKLYICAKYVLRTRLPCWCSPNLNFNEEPSSLIYLRFLHHTRVRTKIEDSCQASPRTTCSLPQLEGGCVACVCVQI